MLYLEIKEDRTGVSGPLLLVSSMGDLYLQAYPKPGEDHSKYPKAPIDLVWNHASRLLQNRQTVNRNALYDEYWYTSAGNESMVCHLRDVVKFALGFVDLADDDVVLDIASNDGTLLRHYKGLGVDPCTVGFDPAQNLAEEASRGVTRHYPICFDSCAWSIGGWDLAKIITACAVVYHAPQPASFLRQVAQCLHPKGVFVCEFTYLPTMMKNRAYDAIGHEHITHLSLESFERMLKSAKLEIISAQLGDINSGTILCAIKHSPAFNPDVDGSSWLCGLREYEWHLGMGKYETYIRWADRGEELKAELMMLLEELHEQGKSVYLYGASTKASILLQWIGADVRLIQKAVERNPKKVGREMVGLHIPIISEEQARRENPDYMWVGPWCFRDGFIERERDYLRAGGRMIFPLPKVEVYCDPGAVVPDPSGCSQTLSGSPANPAVEAEPQSLQ